MLNRQLVSDVRSTHKLFSSDSLITDRAILSEVRSASSYLVRQQLEKRKLWQSDNIFTHLPCLEMIEVPLAECCTYTSPRTISRSKERLPAIQDSLFGLVIKNFSPIDQSKDFIYTTADMYANSLKLNLRVKNIFYWLQNGYLYCSLPTLRSAHLVAYFEDEVPNNLLYPQCECNIQPEEMCTNPLDREAKVPMYLVAAVKDMVSKKLLQSFFNLPTDKFSNNADEGSK
jgi:hypothetical protein